MKTADIESVANRQSQRCYAGIPMDEDRNINARMVQRHRRCANIPMNTSITTNVLISQLGTSCAFDSPGLARNEPTPGKRSQGDSTP
ncbi:tetrahydrofolate synthase [Segatella salivae]|uniref:tetrahydrofolate synthase n=1 Tax=Segatella salivae TaxID=228604 RepID=UPI0028ED1B87|nr:tetrahydrofolate synthase [Segatella salivae]